MRTSNSSHLISIDIGTSSAKGMLCTTDGDIVAERRVPYPCYYPRSDWAEQDPDEVLAAVVSVVGQLTRSSTVDASSIQAIVFGGIWNSFLPLDAADSPLCRALTWADLRSTRENACLRETVGSDAVKSATGCTLHPMYFLPRMLWFKNQAPEIYARTARFVSIKEYILTRLYGTRVVDASMASGTGVWNIASKDWDRGLLKSVGLGDPRFSDCVEPTTIVTGLKPVYAEAMGLCEGTPGVVGAADGALAHLGTAGLVEGRMSLSVGTSIAMRACCPSPRTDAGSEAWCYYLADGNWLRGGVIHDGGNTLRWFADNIIGAESHDDGVFDEMNNLASKAIPGASGLFFFPYFGGERCPNFNPDARGGILGLSFSHDKTHMSRALYEGLAYCIRSLYRMLADERSPDLVVTGGIQKSPVWLQIVADSLGKSLLRPTVGEGAAWGGVVLGLRAIGRFEDLASASSLVGATAAIEPEGAHRAAYARLMDEYEKLYSRLYSNDMRAIAALDREVL